MSHRHVEGQSGRSICLWWSYAWKALGAPNESSLFHVPNGGLRGKIEASLMKLEGVRAGVSDYILLVPKAHFHGLVLELKSAEGQLSDNQYAFIQQARKHGYCACVAYSTEQAIRFITDYMEADTSMPRNRGYAVSRKPHKT